MHHVEAGAEAPIFVLQGVEAVRIRGDDAIEAAGIDSVDVGLGQRLEQALLAGAPYVDQRRGWQ